MKILAIESSSLVASAAIVEFKYNLNSLNSKIVDADMPDSAIEKGKNGPEAVLYTSKEVLHIPSKVIAEYTTNLKLTHSETLMPMVEEIFKITGIKASEIDAVAISGGPGSFTGLRIGSAAAKGLGFALGIPLIHVPTLEAMAYNFYGFSGIVAPAMDARRDQIYAGAYSFSVGGAALTTAPPLKFLTSRGSADERVAQAESEGAQRKSDFETELFRAPQMPGTSSAQNADERVASSAQNADERVAQAKSESPCEIMYGMKILLPGKPWAVNDFLNELKALDAPGPVVFLGDGAGKIREALSESPELLSETLISRNFKKLNEDAISENFGRIAEPDGLKDNKVFSESELLRGNDVFYDPRVLKEGGVFFAPAHMNAQRAGTLGVLAVEYFKAGRFISAADEAPDYMRVSQAERMSAEHGKKQNG